MCVALCAPCGESWCWHLCSLRPLAELSLTSYIREPCVGRAGVGAGVPCGHWRNYPPLPEPGGKGASPTLGTGDASQVSSTILLLNVVIYMSTTSVYKSSFKCQLRCVYIQSFICQRLCIYKSLFYMSTTILLYVIVYISMTVRLYIVVYIQLFISQ